MKCISCNKLKKGKVFKDIVKYTCSLCIQNNVYKPVVQIYTNLTKPLNLDINLEEYTVNLRALQKQCIRSFFNKDIRTVHRLLKLIQINRKKLIKYYKENLLKFM